MLPSGYMRIADNFRSKGVDIGLVATEILEEFAEGKDLSAYQVYLLLKATYFKMAYKNVHKRIQRLVSLNLIERQEAKKAELGATDHGAKYYRLTEEGIYQLLRRAPAKLAIVNIEKFFEFCSKSMLFDAFLYPYFEKKTLRLLRKDWLIKLFLYLHDCCQEVDSILKVLDMPGVRAAPHYSSLFSWNKVPGPHSKAVLSTVKENFNLQDIDNASIEKNDNGKTIYISTAKNKHTISIKLDSNNKKVVMAGQNIAGKPMRYEYEIPSVGTDLDVCKKRAAEEYYFGSIDNKVKPLISIMIELLRPIAHEEDFEILAQDDKFMKATDDAYKKFEYTYKKLMTVRTKY
jgi:hypothetical protein